jgi:glutamate carboxypeptidase
VRRRDPPRRLRDRPERKERRHGRARGRGYARRISELRQDWIQASAAEIGGRLEREIEALVAVSSPSGDVDGAEDAVAVAAALLPGAATVERPPCSSPAHAPDLCARIAGTGEGRVLLLGHLDTVVAHGDHRHLERHDGMLVGSGTIDMKGGVAIALGVLRALAEVPSAFAEAALLLVVDEEWRTGGFSHGPAFAGWDACLCFEAGELGPGGEPAVVLKRKAAGTLRIRAHGRAAHSGAAPELGRSALLPLAAAAERVAALHDPHGPDRLSAVPTVMHCGDAFNVVPAQGELVCDLRADGLGAFEPVLGAVPPGGDGVEIEAEIVRRWPGMDTRELAGPVLARAGELVGAPILGSERGGASDASHMAQHVPLTIDGLGPLGGGAHAPEEYVDAASLVPRTEVALALAAAVTAA